MKSELSRVEGCKTSGGLRTDESKDYLKQGGSRVIMYWSKMALFYRFPFISIRIILSMPQISILSNNDWTVRKQKLIWTSIIRKFRNTLPKLVKPAIKCVLNVTVDQSYFL